jgi:TatA/E family protein of Tat protein translocase
MGPLGWQETVALFVLALLLFGPKKLPELGKTIGKAITEFRRASSDFKATWDREMITLERENESLKEVTGSVQNELNDYNPSSSYEDGSYDAYPYDSTAESSSTVSASATEGAESTDAIPEADFTTTEAGSEEAGEATEAVIASSGEPDTPPKPVGAADDGSLPESQAVAS